MDIFKFSFILFPGSAHRWHSVYLFYFIKAHHDFMITYFNNVDDFPLHSSSSHPPTLIPLKSGNCWCLLLFISAVALATAAHFTVPEKFQSSRGLRCDPEEQVSNLTTLCASGVFNWKIKHRRKVSKIIIFVNVYIQKQHNEKNR